MIIDCCSQERSYSTFYGLIGECFCKLNWICTESFEEAFNKYYLYDYPGPVIWTVYETSPDFLDISSPPTRFPGWYLIASRSMKMIRRVVVVFRQDHDAKNDGRDGISLRWPSARARVSESRSIPSEFESESLNHFAINYFTSIGLGVITEEIREYLKVRSWATFFFF